MPQLRVKRRISECKNTMLYKNIRSVNPQVVGSSPTRGAKEKTDRIYGLFFLSLPFGFYVNAASPHKVRKRGNVRKQVMSE